MQNFNVIVSNEANKRRIVVIQASNLDHAWQIAREMFRLSRHDFLINVTL